MKVKKNIRKMEEKGRETKGAQEAKMLKKRRKINERKNKKDRIKKGNGRKGRQNERKRKK